MLSTPCGVVVSCLVHGLKLDWKFVSMVSPKWHHGMVSFSSWKQQTLTLKSCDHSFQPIRRLHSVKSHKSLEKLWDFMQKEFPFKEQSCETALLKSSCLYHRDRSRCGYVKMNQNTYPYTFWTTFWQHLSGASMWVSVQCYGHISQYKKCVNIQMIHNFHE